MFKTAPNRTLGLSGDALPTWGDEPLLAPLRLRATETLGKLYRYTLDVATIDSPTLGLWQAQELVALDSLIGKVIDVSIAFDGNGLFGRQMLETGNAAHAGAAAGAGSRTISGLITGITQTGTDGRRAHYRFIVRPWLWLATKTCESRIFHDASVVDITDSILKERYHFPVLMELGAPGLCNGYPKRDYVRQMWESDFAFLTRIWREWGIYYLFDGMTLVLCDSPGSHKQHDNAYASLRYHPRTDRQVDEEHIHKIKVSSRLTTGKVSLIDYDYTRPGERFEGEYNSYSDSSYDNLEQHRWGDYSQPLAGAAGLSGKRNDFRSEAEHLASVRVDAMRSRRLRLKGQGNLRGLTTGKTFWLNDHPQREVNAEYLVVSTTLDIRNAPQNTQSPGDGPSDALRQCMTDFVLQPANSFFRNRPKKKPRCATETAIVVAAEDRPIWVDGYARVKVRFVWDRLGPKHAGASCWVRVSSPWQGNGFGAIYSPRVGQEVSVSYHEGDPDKPYVSGRMVNDRNQPPWKLPDNQALSGVLSKELKEGRAGQTNHVVLDDTPEQLQAQLASDHAQSRLVLGYNTRVVREVGRQQARGEGWELATDAWGVARANRGMLITTDARHGSTAPAKDIGETMARLTQACGIHENLAGLARRYDAQEQQTSQSDVSRTIKLQNDAIRGGAASAEQPFAQLAQPDMVLASAAGVSLNAAQSTHVASVDHVALTAGGHVSIAAVKSLLASAVNGVRVFAQHLGIRLKATSGKVQIDAQSDDVEIIAQRVVSIISRTDSINLMASKEIVFHAGNTKVVINSEGYKVYTAGEHRVHARSHRTDGPAVRPVNVPVTPGHPGKLAAHHVLIEHDSGFALPNQPYRITLDDGQRIQGVTNALGEMSLVTSNMLAFATVELFAASEPDKVIAVSKGAVIREANEPFAGAVPNAEKRSAKVAGKAVASPDPSATTEDKAPEFVSCDPMNFGLRFYHFVHGATEADAPAGMSMRKDVEYAVTKAYTAAIKTALQGIDWAGVTWPLTLGSREMIEKAVGPNLEEALSAGPFGLPRPDAANSENGGAMPKLVIVNPRRATEYNLRQDVSAAFLGKYWLIAVNESEIARIIELRDRPSSLDNRLRAFADTLYHESRHCQQYFWMFSLLQHFPDDYRDLPNIQLVYRSTTLKKPYAAAGNTTLPDDHRVHIGLHRMLVFHYYWLISYMQDKPGWEYVRRDLPLAERKVCELLNVSAETAQKMAQFETGYRSQLHEEDAYACAEVVQAYWRNPGDPLVRNPGTCTAQYIDALRIVGTRS
ncbi:type VI secretion system tip protein VgrG [Paraburkholderia sprentiae WSM5005]|uniref:Type VI secretion system tip protein VgrG n=1 Tax=Paraburkholderia sprentiae WSM5005 TaxID=754502 RepID=A0A1I9YGN9_9BURK|nr:type VI secretion system Vgr family protein [Paraburkholderia sprentiae]APA85472.1 type VI secretion system tip protein VgrG [Paraburkholderia sprentiae WSM5005]